MSRAAELVYHVNSVTRNKVQVISSSGAVAAWSLLTKHGQVLLSVAQDPQMRLRDIATTVDLTERRVHAILGDLIDSGYLLKVKVGRRNRYEINADRPVPDFASRAQPIGEVVQLLVSEPAS